MIVIRKRLVIGFKVFVAYEIISTIIVALLAPRFATAWVKFVTSHAFR